MDNNNKELLLLQQVHKIEDVLNVLRTQFGDKFENEVNYLSIVKANLEEASTK